MFLLIANVFSLIYLVNSDPVPFITKCSLGDSKCAKESSQKAIPIFAAGLPEYGVEQLDPLHLNKIDASSPTLKLVLTDVTVAGLKDCKAKKIQHDVSKSKLTLKFLCDANLDSQYEMGGRLLILPIEGKGKLHVTLRKAVITVELDMGEKVEDGKKHWDIKRWSHSYELKDKSDVDFENLFNGNEVLGRAAREVIASSGNEIVLEVGPPVIKAVVAKVVNNINKFFHHVPAEDLTLE